MTRGFFSILSESDYRICVVLKTKRVLCNGKK